MSDPVNPNLREITRILAVDYGAKRVGLAMSDETKTIASPLTQLNVESDADAVEKIVGAIGDRQVERVVVGLPRNMDGSYGPQAQKVQMFIEKLREKMAVPIETWDERLTTAAAERAMLEADLSRAKRKERRDKIAAQILLQSYLDARSFNR